MSEAKEETKIEVEKEVQSNNSKKIVLTQKEFDERAKQVVEMVREGIREDNTGDKDHWGRQLSFNRKRNGTRKSYNREEMKQTKKDRKKIKKQLERQLRQVEMDKFKEENPGQDLPPCNRIENKKKLKEEYVGKMKDAPRVVVDFQFVDQTMERDRLSLMKQVEFCHAENKKSEKPLKLTLSQGEHPMMKKYMDSHHGQNWGIDVEPKDILEAYNKEDIIYMSGDVDVDMDEYEPDKIYIIGGLVEHNRLVNLTKNYCEKNGIKARRLPLSKYMDLRACSLLNINAVFSILLKLHNGVSWQKSISTSVPTRKIGINFFEEDKKKREEKEEEKVEEKEDIEKIEKKIKTDDVQETEQLQQ